MDIVWFFVFMAGSIATAAVATIIFVLYKLRKDDVISIDNIKTKRHFYTLKQIADDESALEQIVREYDSGVYRNLD